MKKKTIIKLIAYLCFFLFSSLLLPNLSPNGQSVAYAGSVEKDKTPEYRLYVKSVTLVKGKTFTLKVSNLGDNAKVSYRSADTEIASVNDDGIITAKNVGTTNITVTIKDGSKTPPTLTCEVKVGPPAFSVKVTKSRIILGVNKSETLNVILKPSNTTENAIFSSADSHIATVSTGGRATGVKEGLTFLFAEIDAQNHDGLRKFASCTVIVVDPEDVAPLENYFSDHPELNLISESELVSVLSEFFNDKWPSNKSSDSLVEHLDKLLDDKFDLSALKKELEL